MGDYKKKYNDLIERLRKAIEDNDVNDERYCCVITDIVPELKESEDERIRKAIHIYLDWLDGRKDYAPKGEYSIKDMIAWLERQDEFKNIDSDDLATLEIWENAIKENKEKWQLSDWFIEATSLLIQKVKRIENNPNKKPQRIVSAEAKEAMYDKPAWSEEDKKNLQGIIDEIEANKAHAPYCDHATYDRFLSWLKSLRLQSTWKPSDKQIKALNAINVIGEISYVGQRQELINLYEQLKKLREE